MADSSVRSLAVLAVLLLVPPGHADPVEWEDDEGAQITDALARLLESEEVLLGLTPQLYALDASVVALSLPSTNALSLFSETVLVSDLSDTRYETTGVPGTTDLESARFPVASNGTEVAKSSLQLWGPLFEGVAFFERAHFKILRGKFVDEERDTWEADLQFTGLAKMTDDSLRSFSGKVLVRWRRTTSPGERVQKRSAGAGIRMGNWTIREWQTQEMAMIHGRLSYFEEVLERVVLDPADRQLARRSIHEEELVDLIRSDEKVSPRGSDFEFPAGGYHPSVAVVDIDVDGDDDLYVTRRWGRGLLYVNDGKGLFEERASEFGLDLDLRQSSVLFGDFDNDGDPDAFMAGFLQRSVYLTNEAGRFVDRSDTHIDGGALPGLATSLSAADYDGDGLLDVHIATYHRQAYGAFNQHHLSAGLLDENDHESMLRAIDSPTAHRVLNRYGPPNYLLRNVGNGRFEMQPRDATTGVAGNFRNTYQASWADYDGDGDPDLYCANDFAPNNLFRNDGAGKFTDVTEETGSADIGFGMGASWGDFDEDGWLDLYVTNMFSNAGLRITAAFIGVNPNLVRMAHGNTLFRNPAGAGGGLQHVSGLEPPRLTVERAGWSWGGQFIDFDNDGDLDIHAVNGFYTAPDEVAVPVDR